MAAAEQQWRGRTATHANMATAGEHYSHLPAAADGDGHAALATDAVPTAAATSTANGKLWWCVCPGQPDRNVWHG